jgi:hypothetical protein
VERENQAITVREEVNHGNNRLMVGFLAILAFPAFIGLVTESILFQRLDDGIIFLLAVAAAIWYFGKRNRYQRSFAPLALIIASFALKVGSAFMESSNPTDLDDFPLLFAFLISLIISIVIYVRSRDKVVEKHINALTAREAINRGKNQLMVGLLALTFFPLIGPALGEDNLFDRLDDGFIVLLAIAAIVWYFVGRNRYHHSFAPLALVIVSFIAQAGGLFLEIGDPLGEGIDDFVVMAAMTVGLILSIIIYYSRTREHAALVETPSISQMGSPQQ